MSEQQDETQSRRELIAQLFGAFGRTPTEAQFAGYEAGLKRMPTPSLARVVSTWLERIEEATEPGELRVPTPGKLWELRRKLKALPAPFTLEHTPAAHEPDGWAKNANTLLLAYVTQGLVGKSIHGTRTPMRNASRYAPDSHYDPQTRHAVPGPLTKIATAILVKWKDGWAADMREDRAEGGSRDGKALWFDYMTRAEAEIDQQLKAAA
jgi:hypothetical protein